MLVVAVVVAIGAVLAAMGIRDFAYRNAVSIRPDPDFANDVDRLIRGILNLEDLPRQET